MRNPEYWRGDAGFVGYRLSSLAAGAWDGVRNLDMSVLDVSPQKGEASYTSHVPVSDFERSFIIGKMITGRIDRRAHGALGWLVACEVDGKAYRCFVPDTEIDQTIATPGFVGQFEVISTLPQKRSVLLRFVKSEAVVRQKAELETRESLSIDPVLLKIKERLSRLKQLHLDGELDDEEYTSRRQRIIDAI